MAIKQARAAGATLDEVMTKLSEIGVTSVSRSALGRHVKKMGELCPVSVAQEFGAVRGSIDRLSAAVGELRRELAELRAGDLALLRGSVQRLHEDMSRTFSALRGLRAG